MVKEKLSQVIESILFASDIPLSVQKIKEFIENQGSNEIRKAIDELSKHYNNTDSALQVMEVAGGYQLVTRPEFADYIQKLYKGRAASRLTHRALETLAIITYKQPITKQEMEAIRGVNVDGVVKTLLERNLIKIEGRQKAPGNPLLYGTTKYFLQYFGLKSLDDLPQLKEIDELLKGDEKFLESLDQVALEKLAPEALGLKNIEQPDQDQIELGITEKNSEIKSEQKEQNSNDKTE